MSQTDGCISPGNGSFALLLIVKLCLLFYLILFCLGLHQWHMEVPRLGVESELQLLAYTTATAMPDQSCICDLDLYHSSWQRRILNQLSDRTHILMDTNQICFHCATTGNPSVYYF